VLSFYSLSFIYLFDIVFVILAINYEDFVRYNNFVYFI
jgi:hypothetical protein